MYKDDLNAIRIAGDLFAKKIHEQEHGDVNSWNCLYRKLSPGGWDEERREYRRIADWQAVESVKMIRALLSQLEDKRTAERLSTDMGSATGEDGWLFVDEAQWSHIRDLICIRAIEVLHKLP